jgi:hypothetical protein
MKFALSFLVVCFAGCSLKKTQSSNLSKQLNTEDFYFQVIEIKSSLHESIISRKPWLSLNQEPAKEWNLSQVSRWLELQYPKLIEKTKLRLLKSHLTMVDPKSAYTPDIEQSCWNEVDRLVHEQLRRTAVTVSKKSQLKLNRPLDVIVQETLASNSI